MSGKVPPMWVIRAATWARDRVGGMHRRMAPPPVAVLDLIFGGQVSQAVAVAAQLGISDALKDGTLPAEDVAERVDANPDAVNRLLRALTGYGLFRTDRAGRYRLTPMGAALRSDAEPSVRSMAVLIGSREHREHWSLLLDAVRTGEPAVPKVRGMDYWSYLEHNREHAEVFNDAMTSMSGFTKPAVLGAYDFSGFRKIVDVGGGHGALLAGILRQAPDAEGVLYDLPSVTSGATDVLRDYGVAERCAVESGSFLEKVPEGGDAYVLKAIIHDWPDEKALAILRHVREAIDPHGRLLLVEMVLSPGDGIDTAKLVDLEMLVMLGSRERTEDGYRELFESAGFRLTRIVPTASPMSVIEAAPA